jgi:hypothetical protein
MATRTSVVTYAPNGHRTVVQAVWSGLLQSSSDVGDAVELPGADRTVQLTGTLGVGGAATIQGSQDGTNFATVKDAGGSAVVLSAIGQLAQITESVRFIRPNITAGDGTTNLSVTLVSRRAA